MTKLRAFLIANRWLALAFALVVGLSIYFAIGAVSHARKWQSEPPAAVQPWMTNRYIAHTWKLPREMMDNDLNLPRTRGGPMTLTAIADERGIDVNDLIAEIEAAIAAHAARTQ